MEQSRPYNWTPEEEQQVLSVIQSAVLPSPLTTQPIKVDLLKDAYYKMNAATFRDVTGPGSPAPVRFDYITFSPGPDGYWIKCNRCGVDEPLNVYSISGAIKEAQKRGKLDADYNSTCCRQLEHPKKPQCPPLKTINP